MCKSIAEGGERCLYSLYQPRLNRLEATLNKKEEELAALYRLKMKPADVLRRIRELEATIAHKRSYLAQVENRVVSLSDGNTFESEATRVKEDIRVLEEEVEDLKYIDSKAFRRKIEGLEATIAKKKVKLEELTAEAEVAKVTHEAEKAAAAAESEAKKIQELNSAALKRMYNEDSDIPRDFHFLLTPDEREWVENNRGEESASEFLLRRSITAPPVFPTATAAALLESRPKKTRHDTSSARSVELKNAGTDREVPGRKPSVDKRVRDAEVFIKGDVQGRAVLRYYEAQMADSYGLSMNQYARRRALGLDLYENDGHVGVAAGQARLAAFAKKEHRAFIPNLNPETGRYTVDSAEDLAEFRRNVDLQAQRDAYERTAEKFGHDITGTVFARYFDEMPDEALPFDAHHRVAA